MAEPVTAEPAEGDAADEDEHGGEAPPGDGGPLDDEWLAGGDAEDERLEARDDEDELAEARGEDLDESEELEHDDGELAEEADYDAESDPDVADLPDPEDFHEGDELLDEPEPAEVGEGRTVAPPAPAPPPPITASRPPLPPRPPPPPRTAQGPILPPYEKSRPGGGSWEDRNISTPKAVAAVGAIVVVVAAAAFGVLQLTGGDDGAKEVKQSNPPGATKQPAKEKKQPGAPGIDPRSVTVAVLNGTTVGGLAATLGDRLKGQGFQLGNVTNNTDQQRAESVVLFAPGSEDEAKDVGRRLKIDQREPIDPDSQTRAGDATVVVVTGADLNK